MGAPPWPRASLTPPVALKLADEYRIGHWIKALLDPTPIDKGPADPQKSISPPPTFVLPEFISFQPPAATPGRGRGARQRSGSPAKTASPKKTASPRKRASKATNAAHASAASATLQTALNNAASAAEARPDDTVKVEVDSAVETNGATETTHTNVRVELPAGSAELPLPERTEEMLNTAKKMVEEARKLDGKAGVKTSKRKAADDAADEPAPQPAKKARVLEEELKKERVKTKALLGLSATLAIGYVVAAAGATGPADSTGPSCRTCCEGGPLEARVRLLGARWTPAAASLAHGRGRDAGGRGAGRQCARRARRGRRHARRAARVHGASGGIDRLGVARGRLPSRGHA